jgi:recombinational DNA repair protein (RecF pathway)
MGDFGDQQKLLALDGGMHECACCGSEYPVEAVDVVDGEVVCIDCVHTYHPGVYARRTGEPRE